MNLPPRLHSPPFSIYREMGANDPVFLQTVDQVEAGLPGKLALGYRLACFVRDLHLVQRLERLVAPENFRESDIQEIYKNKS